MRKRSDCGLGVGGRQSNSGHQDVEAQFGSDEGNGGWAFNQCRFRGPGFRQQTEPGDVGASRDLQRDLPEGSGGTEEADEGRKVRGVAEATLTNRRADLDIQEWVPWQSVIE